MSGRSSTRRVIVTIWRSFEPVVVAMSWRAKGCQQLRVAPEDVAYFWFCANVEEDGALKPRDQKMCSFVRCLDERASS